MVPDLDAVGDADDDRIAFDERIVFEVLRHDEPALLVGQDVDGAGKKHPVEIADFLLGEGCRLEFLLLQAPLLFAEHKKTLVQPARQKEALDAVLLAHVAEFRRQDETSFAINAVSEFTVEHRVGKRRLNEGLYKKILIRISAMEMLCS